MSGPRCEATRDGDRCYLDRGHNFQHSFNAPVAVDVASVSVNHPEHYFANGIEAIDVIEAFDLGFCLGNVAKYLLRADRKGRPVEDLEKAAWYLQREIEQRKGGAK